LKTIRIYRSGGNAATCCDVYLFITFSTISCIYSVTTPTKATQQNSPQILPIKIMEVNDSFQQIIFVIKQHISKATEL